MDVVFFFLWVLFIVFYGWANHIFLDYNPLRGYMPTPKRGSGSAVTKFSTNGNIAHQELNTKSRKDYILYSGVCKLGRIVFYLWVITLFIYLMIKCNNIIPDGYNLDILLLNPMVGLTMFVTLVMNFPLFIRALPAFGLMFAIINVKYVDPCK